MDMPMSGAETAELKKSTNAHILAHNYAPRDIQDVADAVGDSLYLVQMGADSNADVLENHPTGKRRAVCAFMKQHTLRKLRELAARRCALNHPHCRAGGAGAEADRADLEYDLIARPD
jgi:quinolinate synthase